MAVIEQDAIRVNSMPAIMPVLGISEAAATRLQSMMREKELNGYGLRVFVSGGGCSGFQYAFELDAARLPDDLIVERDGAIILIDPFSLPFVSGSEIDFVDDLIGQSFQVHNPNATASCGCGTSFSI